MEITSLNQLNPQSSYTHLEYLSWKFHERVELILGKIFPMSPAANTRHQHCSMMISVTFWNFFKGTACRVFHAPFDVFFLSEDGKSDTVLQPDIVVVCDPTKIKLKGCFGAPDLVVEIISPSSVARDLHEKYSIYESFGVKEYWIVQPEDRTVTIHCLNSEGRFQPMKIKTLGDRIESPLFPGLQIDPDEIFRNVVYEEQAEYGREVVRIY